jgi:hypothetical protein
MRKRIEVKSGRALRERPGAGHLAAERGEARNARLGHTAQEHERGVQVLFRHRATAARLDRRRSRIAECTALRLGRPEREEQPPRELTRRRAHGLPG